MERQRCGPPGGVPFELEVTLLVGLVVLFAGATLGGAAPTGTGDTAPNPEDDPLYRVIKAVLVVVVVVGTTYLVYRVGTDVVNTVQPREISIRPAPGVRIHEVHNLPRPNTTAIEAVARSLSSFLRGGRH